MLTKVKKVTLSESHPATPTKRVQNSIGEIQLEFPGFRIEDQNQPSLPLVEEIR